MVADSKTGTIKKLHTGYYMYDICKRIPIIQVELDENRDLEYFASLTNIKKI